METYKLMMGVDLPIAPKIELIHPTVKHVFENGGEKYLAQVASFVATPTDLMVELDDFGVNFEEITEWQLFIMRFPTFKDTAIKDLIKGLDLNEAEPMINETGEIVVFDPVTLAILDEAHFRILCEYLRKIHGLQRNVEVFGNDFTRKMVIDIERETRKHKAYKPHEPFLENYVSGLINCSESKYDYHNIWDVPFFVFMDAVKRVQKVMEFKGLMSGMCSGMIDMKKIDMNKVSWIGKLD